MPRTSARVKDLPPGVHPFPPQAALVRPGRRPKPAAPFPAHTDEPRLEIVEWPVADIVVYDRNPRINDDVVGQMADAIRRYGFTVPMVVQELGNGKAQIVDGHLRFKAACLLKRRTVPVVIIPPTATEKYVRGLRISINRMAEAADWDEALLAEELKQLEADGADDLAAASGFDTREINALLELADDTTTDDDALDRRKGEYPVPDPDQDWEGVGQYDLPALRVDRLLDCPAPSTWAGTGITNGPPPYAYNFDADSSDGLDWKQAILCFHSADHKIDCWWAQPDTYVGRFLERGTTRAVTPNFSVFAFWPFARRLFNTFRSRWVGRYMQEAGMMVVPDICVALQDLDWAFDGIPGRSPLSINLCGKYGKFTKKEIRDETRVIEAILDFHPARLWVYADKKKLQTFPVLRKKQAFPVEFIEPRLVVRKQQLEGFQNGRG